MTEAQALAIRVQYAIVCVRDMKRSVPFYRDVLGLTLRFESPGWTEFATEGATLALHASDAAVFAASAASAGSAGSAADDPLHLPPGRCRPGLRVPDLDEFHRRMVENDVTCVQQPERVFGVRVAQYLDPDGLPISVGEEGR